MANGYDRINTLKDIENLAFKDLIASLISKGLVDAESLEDELNAVDIADKLTSDE